LVDLAIMVGTGYNQGLRGIGPKTALKLVKEYGSLENMPTGIRGKVPERYQEIRDVFLDPDVSDTYRTNFGNLDEDRLLSFLVDEKGFDERRVETVLERMRRFYSSRSQTGLATWL